MNNHTIWDKDSTNICRLLQGIVLHFLLIMSYAPCEDWYSTRQYLRFLIKKLPCKRVNASTIININLPPFPENACAWFSYPHFLKKSDEFCTVSAKEILLTCIIQKISKGFHPYQSSLVNKGFNMQPDWDSFSCCNKASKQERLILSIK